MWHLIYKDIEVLHIIESTVTPQTIYSIFSAATKEECLVQAKTLGLSFPTILPTDMTEKKFITAKFIKLFTQAEWISCLSFTYSGTGNVIAMILMMRVQTQPEIDLHHIDTINGINFWVQVGCLTEQRASIILNS